ncbi:MAG: tetratricopeptide repeat protein [Alphaproteobacteria bacterium]|nr:MAG: tetratricopeptide repeat protein [Alphaproteobacteria bacterium]
MPILRHRLTESKKTAFARRLVSGGAALAVVAALQLTSLPGGLSDLGVSSAYAQEKKREKPQTRQSDTVSKKVGDKLVEVQELIEQEQWSAALAELQKLSRSSNLKPYEQAVIYQMMGQVYASMEDYQSALNVLEQARALKAFPPDRQLDLQFYIGQLYMAVERYDDAIRTLEEWLREAGDASTPSVYFVLAQAYSVKENYSSALRNAEKGMQLARELDDKRKNWWAIVANLYLQQQRYKDAQGILREMVALWPGIKSQWNQLGATYSLLEQDEMAYNILMMMYYQNMFSKSSEYERVGQASLYFEFPYRGARLLKEGFDKEIVEKDADNYELLAITYQESREWKKAIPPLTEAAKLSKDGNLYMQLCQSYLFDRKFGSAESACVSALNKGDLNDTGNAWMLLGTARYSNDKRESALEAFEKASKFEKTAKNANQWIKFIKNEKAQEEARKQLDEELKKREEEEAAKFRR